MDMCMWRGTSAVVSQHFKGLITDVTRIEGLSIATHWGVRLSLRAGPGAALVQQLKVPKKLPK
eukprot:2170927-Pyramimonas_sp.AAC.1